MDSEDTMQAQTGADQDKPGMGEHGGEEEAVSVFLPKAAFGERPPKVGDSLKDFKVVDIDPETGDVEAKCSYEENGENEEGGMMDEFDKAMPADKEGY